VKRWTLRIVLCLILGAITTVAVAWGCALWVLPQNPPRQAGLKREGTLDWVLIRWDVSGSVILWSERHDPQRYVTRSQFVTAESLAVPWVDLGTPVNQREREVRRVEARGWPYPALYLEFEWRGTDDPMTYSERRLGMIPTGLELHDWGGYGATRDLPLIPIWFGFIVNSLIFMVAWLLLVSYVPPAYRWARHRWRHKEGECPRCRYDLRGDLKSGCPECGWNRGSEVRID